MFRKLPLIDKKNKRKEGSAMKLVSYKEQGISRFGALDGEEIADLCALAPDLKSLLVEGKEGLAKAADAAKTAPRSKLSQVTLLAPIPEPRVILAIGLNYHDHIAEFGEAGRTTPPNPVVFNKQVGAINGPYQPFHLPKASQALDYEGELALIIGKPCRHVKKENARDVIAGYTVANDVSVRDWQGHSPTMTMGKSFDTHCPLGPTLVTADEISDPHNLDIKTWVNGELRQDSNTKHLIFDCDFLIEYLSTVMTLLPGDIILTGTPSGVAAAMQPPQWLKVGDKVRIEISGIGEIENEVVSE
jgi:2-keto-4-pentenoate hydratase/2-oxohepta-3-ene-1,7-dioic acid hydratase in catechol pathway